MSGVSTVYKKENLSCLIDAGDVTSIGRFITDRLDVIELGLCQFDGSVSGFRWNEETGWEAIFLVEYSTDKDRGGIRICTSTAGNTYSKEEIALGLEEFYASRHSTGST